MKAIQRVKQYIDKQGFNNSSFEKKNKLSNGYIGTQIKRNADLGEGILNKILDNCLDLNPEWLLTGKGEMLKTSQSQNVGIIEYKDKYLQSLEENRELNKENRLLNKKNRELRREIDKLKEEELLAKSVKEKDKKRRTG